MIRYTLAVGLLCAAAAYAPMHLWATSSTGPDEGKAAIPAHVSSNVIFDNVGPNGGLNGGGASPASQYDGSFPFDAGAADEFILPSSPLCTWVVTGVRWSGLYWSTDDHGVITGFRIVFWPDDDGIPAGGGCSTPDLSQALAVYDIPGNANETPNLAVSSRTFDYSADLAEPFPARPGVRYWVEIQPVMTFPPQWGCHVTHGRQGAGPVEYFDLLGLPAWTSISDPGDLGFQLVGEPRDVTCDDGNACTEDACDAGTGCVFTDVTCDDGSACTTDTCDPATGCVFTPITCDDGNACTDDTCDPNEGCAFTPIDCDDQDPCTVDTCVDGTCVHSTPPDFDGDGDVDLEDFKLLCVCVTGSAESAAETRCPCADLNGDGRADLRDYAAFQAAFTGGL